MKKMALLAIMLAFIACVSGGCGGFEGSEEEDPVNRTAYIRNMDGTVIVVEAEKVINWNAGLMEIKEKNGDSYRTSYENVLIVEKRGNAE